MDCYHFAGWALLSADWMQVWGSIVGAGLGAWLAIKGSRKLAQEQEDAAARNYAAMLYAVVQLMGNEANTLASGLEDRKPREAETALRLLDRQRKVFDRFPPFTQLGAFGSMKAVVQLQLALEKVCGHLDRLEALRKGVGMRDAYTVQDLIALPGHASELIDAIDDARKKLIGPFVPN